MSKELKCKKCSTFLGEMVKGSRIRHGSVFLCSTCWEKADIAIQMADLAATQGKNALKGDGSDVVDNLMDMFGMKK